MNAKTDCQISQVNEGNFSFVDSEYIQERFLYGTVKSTPNVGLDRVNPQGNHYVVWICDQNPPQNPPQNR